MVEILVAKRFHSDKGMAVSPASVHFFPMKGDQSTVNLVLKLSVQNTLERISRGSEVVKPIWLLMMMCTVPPVE